MLTPTREQRLGELRAQCRTMLIEAERDGISTRAQPHPALSPLAWHLGHVFFVETYWLREVLFGDTKVTAGWQDLYFPEFCPKDQRTARLPSTEAILDWTRTLEHDNNAWWAQAQGSGHRLMADNYLPHFLIQHYAQHLETMTMADYQARAQATPEGAVLRDAADPTPAMVAVAGGESPVGTDCIAAYDNEQPAHTVYLAAFRIARHAVTNAQWLAFMQDGGYHQNRHWTADGLAWRDHAGTECPQHWRPHPDGGWVSANPADPLLPAAPVHGLCAHEADAFASWMNARLPHEHEWETARQSDHLADVGQVWEWSANPLFAYPGFRSFPYEGYSTPWFDGAHRVLRGASRHTRPDIHRPSFRNFYPATHRHVFAGLRLTI